MLIKQADDHTAELAQLEHEAKTCGGNATKQVARDLAMRKAGLKGEKESAYFIDFHYATSPNWAVIHDLRVEHNGRTAQIDHLLINRWLECYVLETKHFHAGVKITEDGEFMRWNDYKHTFEGMPSPLLQNERHIAVLRDVMETLDLPTRLGMRMPFSFQTFVLIAPNARIDRPKKFDTSRVIKADQIKERIWRDIDKENALFGLVKTAARIVSGATVNGVAQQLVEQHRQTKWHVPAPESVAASTSATPTRPAVHTVAAPAVDASSAEKVAASSGSTAHTCSGPQCKGCHSCDGSILYGKYGYYFQCAQCHTNTAVKFTCLPGHQARLRKAGNEFFRDCAACGSSEPYFTNA